MSHSPLSQFSLISLIKINFMGIDISFTNSALYMLMSILAIIFTLAIPLKNAQLIPVGMQNFPEIIYKFLEKTLTDIAGKAAMQYFSFVFSLFLFVLFGNLLGMLPYSFTTTSHVSITFSLAIFIFVFVTIIGFVKHGIKFLSFFLPSGTPIWLAPLMIVIELFAYLARPISLSIRLAANMIAGHILLKVLAGFVILMGLWGWVPIPFMIIFTAFEIFVAILQAYIFTILVCVYLNDSLNLH